MKIQKAIGIKEHMKVLEYVKKMEIETTRSLLIQACVIFHITGMRRAELQSLKTQDIWIAIATGNLTIKQKTEKTRTLMLNKEERALLGEIFADKVEHEESKLIFSAEMITILSACIRKTLGSKYSVNSYRFGYALKVKKNSKPTFKITVNVLEHDKEISIKPDRMEQNQILRVLAVSKSTPMKVLKMLLKSEDKSIKRWLGENTNLSLKVLIELLKDENPYVRYGILANPKIKQRIVDEKAGEKKKKILKVLSEKDLEIVRDMKEKLAD